ncbi:MAG TPA: hypothetical protein VIJ39_01265 [Solirubrobacteraceae bacterium]
MCNFTRTGGTGSASTPNSGDEIPTGVAGSPGSDGVGGPDGESAGAPDGDAAGALAALAVGTTVSAAAQVKLAPSSTGWARRTRPAMCGLDKEVSLGIRLRG